MAKTDVANVKENPAAVYDYASLGLDQDDDFDPDEMVISFWNIMQAGSPEVASGEAKPGQIRDNVTGEVYDKIHFLPAFKNRMFVEWEPRVVGQPKPPVNRYEPDDPVVVSAIAANNNSRFGKLAHGRNELVDTWYIYGYAYDPKTGTNTGYGVISCSSTKITPYTRYIQALRGIRPPVPRIAVGSTLSTVSQKNDKGTFFNWKFSPANTTWKDSMLNPGEYGELLMGAEAFKEMASKGRVDLSKEAVAESDDGDKIPF